MPIEAFSVISCATPPTENSHLANKQYVDEAVASASGGGGSGASDRLTTKSQGVYAIGPPNIGMSTNLVPQTAIAAAIASDAIPNVALWLVFFFNRNALAEGYYDVDSRR